jgi:hypothetical protein
MFRERMAYWARILDLSAFTMNAVAVLASIKARSLLAGTYRNKATTPILNTDPRRDMAIAYTQLSRLNR